MNKNILNRKDLEYLKNYEFESLLNEEQSFFNKRDSDYLNGFFNKKDKLYIEKMEKNLSKKCGLKF